MTTRLDPGGASDDQPGPPAAEPVWGPPWSERAEPDDGSRWTHPSAAGAGPAGGGIGTPPSQGPSWSGAPGGWGQGPGAGHQEWGSSPAGSSGPAGSFGPAGPSGPQDQTRPLSEPGGAGPGWAAPAPAGAGRPGGRRTSRLLAGIVAVLVLLGAGYGIGQLRNGSDEPTASGGAGIPVTVTPTQVKSGDEPVAAVAKALLPSVVQLEVGQGAGQGGLGSGVIYDQRGFILTAAHVVDNADQVTVRMADGTKLSGEVLGTDPSTDIGVVKIDRDGLRPAALALKTPLEVGQTAVAIGSPFGLEGSVTSGVVSAVNRSLRTPDGNVYEVVQTDAPINPGNSGGALADREGRVIGINDAIRSESGGNEGVGFAVPIDIAANSAARIVNGKAAEIGFLGVNSSDPALGRAGALIREVVPDSPAAKAGLEVGDLVVSVNGKQVQGGDDLAVQVRQLSPGQRVELRVVRDGKEQTLAATLTKRPSE